MKTPRKIKNFRLSQEACKTLAAAAKRLGITERFIVEWLILNHAKNLKIQVTNGTPRQN